MKNIHQIYLPPGASERGAIAKGDRARKTIWADPVTGGDSEKQFNKERTGRPEILRGRTGNPAVAGLGARRIHQLMPLL